MASIALRVVEGSEVELRARCAAEPASAMAHARLAFALRAAGRPDEALATSKRAQALLGAAERGAPALAAAVIHATLEVELGEVDLALETLRSALGRIGPHPDLGCLHGHAWTAWVTGRGENARRRALESAEACFRMAASTAAEGTFLEGSRTWAAATGEGTALLLLGSLDAAMACFDRALAAQPKHREALLGRAEVLLEARQFPKAFAAIEALLDDGPDGWALAAATAHALGSIQDMKAFLAQAVTRSKRGFLAQHRLEMTAVLAGAVRAYTGTPTAAAGPMAVLGALLAREPLPPDRTPRAAILRMAELLTANLVRSGRGPLLAPLLEPRAEARVPGLLASVQRGLDAVSVSMGDDGEPDIALLVGRGPALAFTRALLDAHPGLRVGDVPEMEDPSSLREAARGDSADRRRAVWVAPLDAVSRVRTALPGARAVFVDTEGAGHRVCFANLLAEPVEAIGRLLACLGAPDDDQPLRYLIEHYPGAQAAREVVA